MRPMACCLSGALLAALAALPARAQQGDWPARPVRLIVPFPPGGANDIAARLITQKLAERWGRPVVIDNRGGAGGNIGTEMGARSAPDGYTLTVGSTSTLSTNVSLLPSLPFDPLLDFAPIAMLMTAPYVLIVHGSVPANSMQELVQFAKKNPGMLNYSSFGEGSSAHLVVEMFKSMAGVDVVHVPYKGGGPAMADLVGGQISGSFASMPSSIPFVRAGKLRALAVTAPKRSPAEPQVPTISEAGIPGFAVLDWQGLFTTGKTPPAIVNKLNAEVVRILALPDVVEKLAVAGVEIQTSTSREWGDFVKSEIAKWGKVVKEAGIKVE